MYELDTLDKQILEILQVNGRATHVDIAQQLSVGNTLVRNRIAKMEEVGVISGYQAVINPAMLGIDVMCIVKFMTDQGQNFDDLVTELLQIDEVVEVSNVTGEVDAHIRIWAKDITDLRHILYDKLSALPAHKSTNSTIVLKRWTKPLGLSGLVCHEEK
jgi:Lrp/AsnC family leucine-responsive transcriptional regulator